MTALDPGRLPGRLPRNLRSVGLLLLGLGAVAIWVFYLSPARGADAARRWTATPCRIVSIERILRKGKRSHTKVSLEVVYAYSGRQDGTWVQLSEEIAKGYADYTPTKGIMQTWDGDTLTVRHGGIPITGGWGAPGKAVEFKAALDQRIANWDGASPLFVSGLIGAWSWTPSDMAELGPLLTDPYELILANSFYDLLNRVLP